MPISPNCNNPFCNRELQEYGGIMISPPNERNIREKSHFCLECYEKVKSFIVLIGECNDCDRIKGELISPPKNINEVIQIPICPHQYKLILSFIGMSL
jgi:hypothetical protein